MSHNLRPNAKWGGARWSDYRAILRLLIKTWRHRLALDFSWNAAGQIATASWNYEKAHFQTAAFNSATTCVVMSLHFWFLCSDRADRQRYFQWWQCYLRDATMCYFSEISVSKTLQNTSFLKTTAAWSSLTRANWLTEAIQCNGTGQSRMLEINLFSTVFSMFTKKKRDLFQLEFVCLSKTWLNNHWTMTDCVWGSPPVTGSRNVACTVSLQLLSHCRYPFPVVRLWCSV